MAGLIWADTTSITKGNLNKLQASLDGTLNTAWAACTFTPGAVPTLTEIAGVASVAQNGTGDYTVTFDSAWVSSTSYAVFVEAHATAGEWNTKVHTRTASTVRIVVTKAGAADETGLDAIAIQAVGRVA